MQVLLLRHGRTPGNEKKRYIGVTDESLSPLGIEDCQRLGSLLLEQKRIQEKFTKIRTVVSPMKRCQESAQILLGIQGEVCNKFQEKTTKSQQRETIFQRKNSTMHQVMFCPDIFLAQNSQHNIKRKWNGKYLTSFGVLEIVTENDLRECNFGIFENKNYLELQNEPLYQQWIDSNGTMDFPQGDCLKEWKKRNVQAFLRQMEWALKEQTDLVIFVVHGGTIMSVMECLEERGLGYYGYQIGNGDGFWAKYEAGKLYQAVRIMAKKV